MVKVSIIVPVHNSESYLYKCVNSLLAQTEESIEIVLVDDCSTDSSRELIKGYVDQNPGKVTPVYLDENIRQGGARNRGMDVARGEYIAFVDSDDFVEPEMCRVLYEAARGADMCGADYYIDDGKSLRTVVVDPGQGFEMTDERKAWFSSHCGYFWSRIYRKDFLEEFQLRFPEKTFFEDAYFNFMTILYAGSMVKAEGQFYHYYQSENSTIRGKFDPRRYERIGIPSLILKDCQARGIYERYRNLIDGKYISMQLGNVSNTCLAQVENPDPAQLARIRDAVKTECPAFAKCLQYRKASFSQRFYLRLTLISPKLAIWARKWDRQIELLGVIEGKLKGKKAS